MRKSSGFTLIELVVVIVILGILAVTAAPKFMSLQGDARISALNGLQGAIKSATSLVYSKAILKGLETYQSASICVSKSCSGTGDQNQVTIAYGYPIASESGILRALQDGDKIISYATNPTGDWFFSRSTNDTGSQIKIYPSSLWNAGNLPNCYVEYSQTQTANSGPSVKLVSTDC